MNTKTIFTIIIAVVFVAAMVIYRDHTLPELISYSVGASGIISAIWNWFRKNELFERNQELEEENLDLRQKRLELTTKLQSLQKRFG